MLYITLRQRILERCIDPKDPNYKKVSKMVSKPIEGFLAYDSAVVPRIGETICINNNQAYDVISVVHRKRCCAGLWHPEVIVEVEPHLAVHNYDAGGYFITEEWPLISDLELENDDEV